MQIVKFPRLSRYLMLAVAVALAMFLVAGCTAKEGTPEPEAASDELGLVWEALDAANSNYAAPNPLDREVMVGGAIVRILEMGEIAPYPFSGRFGPHERSDTLLRA